MKNLIDESVPKTDTPNPPQDEPITPEIVKPNNGMLILVVILAIAVIGLMMYLNYKKNEGTN